ncbi:mercury methylation ferredoxin HgcB [Desulforhopalus singaporensis]|uniref:4Fe-4S dicluster domain-containing protein n=1 Tax=Desulforhopalus singaporensis TaxID=91360 RepID=A0A1H0TZ58_9BACT|nr:mercury methylation ferredoxin HgcB [Desulforhopalus singaporensis]SDP59362.1 4Fe-4S dicluster domain-containing protein [Desulforhopalus singaporensis]
MKTFRYLDNTAILHLTQEQCIGCGNCEIVCPHRIFKVVEKKARITDKNSCMECGACARNCPVGAIFVNPDDGCGCAAYIINSWWNRLRGKSNSPCGC